MATLIENAAEVATCATAIDAAIVAKGGTTAGGLRNAATGIASIPSGGGETHWWDDLDATIFEFDISTANTTISDNGKFPSGSKIWWDADNGSSSESAGYITKDSSLAVSHTYDTVGKKTFIIQNSGASWQSRFTGTNSLIYLSSIIKFQSNITNLYRWGDKLEGCTLKLYDLSAITSSYDTLNGCWIGNDTTLSLKSGTSFNGGYVYGRGTLTVTGGTNVTIIPSGFAKFNLSDATVLNALQNATATITNIYAPNVASTVSNTLYGKGFLENVEVGTLTTLSANTFYGNPGVSVTIDSEGYQLKFKVANTCASFMALANYATAMSKAPTTMKVVCSDGYIAYDSSTSSWVAHTN